VACVVVAGLTLLVHRGMSYDPWSWVTWGREILHLDLDTTEGPAWKPLPMLFTAVWSLFGSWAPDLWIVTARAACLVGLILAFRLGRRLAGPGWVGIGGGVAGAVGLALMTGYFRAGALATSEGFLILFTLLAVDRHVEGRYRQAFAAAYLACLTRPEPWPLLALYALWLLRRDELSRREAVGLGALLLVLWFGPDVWGSGDLLRSSQRAQTPDVTSYSFRAHPLLEAIKDSYGSLPLPSLVGLVGGVALAVRSGRRPLVGAAILGLAWAALVIVAVGVGYAGSQRYLMGATGLLAVVGGAGWALAGAAAARRVGGWDPRGGRAIPWLAVAAFALLGATRVGGLGHQARAVKPAAWNRAELPGTLAAAGGRAAILRCGRPWTDPFDIPLLAWYLKTHISGVGDEPRPGGVVWQVRDDRGRRWIPVVAPGTRLFVLHRRWRLLTRGCPVTRPRNGV
jgi:hypothetical protein